MAETSNIARIATIVSEEVFSVFGWSRRPHKDQNWKCVVRGHKKKTHPSDVVFSYESPLEAGRVYLNVDLKSYAKATITKEAVEKALISLSMSAECANQSEEWQNLYVDPESNARVHSVLFVYNHDGAYNTDFNRVVKTLKSSLFKVKVAYRCFIFGPKDICYLQTISSDILKKRGRNQLPGSNSCHFFHPDLVRARVTSNTLDSATAEMLLSPWQILQFSATNEKPNGGIIVYYRESATTVDELKFLIDYLFRFQLVEENIPIEIRAPFAADQATAFFATAKEQYAKDYHEMPEFIKRLDQIKFHLIPEIQTTFSKVELGMD